MRRLLSSARPSDRRTPGAGIGFQSYDVVVHIDEFIDPVPEPGAALLATAGLALLATSQAWAARG